MFNIITKKKVNRTVPLARTSLKLEKKLKKHVRNVAIIKYGFIKLVVSLFLIKDVIMGFFLILLIE